MPTQISEIMNQFYYCCNQNVSWYFCGALTLGDRFDSRLLCVGSPPQFFITCFVFNDTIDSEFLLKFFVFDIRMSAWIRFFRVDIKKSWGRMFLFISKRSWWGGLFSFIIFGVTFCGGATAAISEKESGR